MSKFDWNDLQAFLALARAGRLTVAAQQMGVDHSTLSRRIAALEDEAFVDRSYALNRAGMEQIVAGLKRAIRASGSARLADTAQDAQATFLPTNELREPVILSLSSAGRVPPAAMISSRKRLPVIWSNGLPASSKAA